MRRTTTIIDEKVEHLDQVKRFSKIVSECVRRADAALEGAGTVGALFTPQAIGARARLRDACEKSILAHLGTHSKHMEEILWRKVYYEPLAAAKKIRNRSSWSGVEICWVWGHLCNGLSFFHHLLHNLAQTTSYHLQDITADFMQTQEEWGKDKFDVFPIVNTSLQDHLPGYDSLHRCLTCLGDLARYMQDLPNPPAYVLPVRYYLQALHFQREGGLTHSNLATIYSASNHPLLSALHYLRALTCEKSFEGAENNLKRLLERSRSIYEEKHCASGEDAEDSSWMQGGHQLFLHTVLTLLFYFINDKTVEDVSRLCQEVLVQLGKVLENYDNYIENDLSESLLPQIVQTINGHGPSSTLNGEVSEVLENPASECFKLTPEAMVIIVALLILCTQRLKKKGSSHTSMAQALLVSILLTLVSHVSSRIEQRISLVDPSFLLLLLPKESDKINLDSSSPVDKVMDENTFLGNIDSSAKKKKKDKNLALLRRRRKVKADNSTASDVEDEHNSECYESEDESNASEGNKEAEHVTDSSEDEEEAVDLSELCSSEDDESDEDVKIEADQEWGGLTTEEHLEVIGQEGMLSAVFVACSWLKSNDDVISLCISTADSLWTAIAKLLNLLKIDLSQLKENTPDINKDVINIFKDLFSPSNLSDTKVNSQLCLKKYSVLNLRILDYLKRTPLPEDLMLHTIFPSFKSVSKQSLNLKPAEMVMLRVWRLVEFGDVMSLRNDTPLWKHEFSNVYIFAKESSRQLPQNNQENETDNKEIPGKGLNKSSLTSDQQDVNTKDDLNDEEFVDMLEVPQPKDSRRLAGMQSLTAQWLQHEVRNLEERTSRRGTLGLYLVPDASVLINHLHVLKTLLANPTHMIIIPRAVIDALDQLKRDSLGARTAIRWLEFKFQQGSRFLRSQRPHERTRLPLIKYPKRKDKEAWEWYQLVECCHYLSSQVHQTNVKTATVTLLTGESRANAPRSSFAPAAVAQTAGAELEYIDEFVKKWQTSTKGHS